MLCKGTIKVGWRGSYSFEYINYTVKVTFTSNKFKIPFLNLKYLEDSRLLIKSVDGQFDTIGINSITRVLEFRV